MKSTNYHNETVDFAVGEAIQHVLDDGTIASGTIRALVAPDLLEIVFDDGDEGDERASTCYHA